MVARSEQTMAREPMTVALIASRPIEKHAVVLGLILVLASLVVYNPAAHYPFINFDDDHYITDNPHVNQGLSRNSIEWAFRTTAEANWHPLTWLSHELDSQLFHLNPAGPHSVNVLLEAMNVWLLFLVLLEATGLIWRSWMVAALFALHPINVESVAWVSERKNLLSMFFFLVALAAYRWYTQKPSLGRHSLVTTLFALGLMAKPQVITFPFVLLLWDYWPLERMRSRPSPTTSSSSDASTPGLPLSKLVLEKLPLLALSVASALITLKAQAAGGAIRTIEQVTMPVRLANAAVSYARYLEKAFWPSHLSVMYPYLWSWHPLWPLALSILVLAIVSGFVFAVPRRYLLVGWLWFLGTLVPMIGLVQVGGQAMADRYAYLPLIGLFLMVSWGAAEIVEDQRWPTAIPAIAALIVFTSLAVTARRQLGYWSDNLTLWSHAIAVTGPNYQAQEHLGKALADQNRMEEAALHFRLGIAIDDRDPVGHFNLAVDDQFQGRIQQAIAGYKITLRLNPDAKLRSQALNNLAMAYHQLDNDSLAETTYKAAVEADPDDQRTWLGMGLVEVKLGNFAAASDAFSRSAQIRPSAVGYLLLEKSLLRSGRTSDAQAARQKAQQLSSDLGTQQQIADRLASH